jgi:hypothetical protein
MSFALRRIAIPLLLLGLFATQAAADELLTARVVIGKQVAMIKTGDVDKVKQGFTKRLQDRITADVVKKAQKELAKVTLDDLVASAAGDAERIKIKMKNGRTLTTIVKVGNFWLADTLWFK